MAEGREYADFDLLIQKVGDESYRAQVLDSPAGEAKGTFTAPFTDLELENFLLRVGRPRQGTRRLESPEMEAARQFGGKLFDAVFQDDVRLSLRRSIDEVERRGEGLRIRLRFSDSPELASLPWEYLFSESTEQFLALSAWTPIVRYLDLTEDVAPLTVTGPLRILVMISGPEDYPELNVDAEWNRIEGSLQPLIDRGVVEIERVDNATLLELQRRLRQNTYHIFHYVGHGGFDEKAEDGVLVLEDGNDRSRLVAGRDVGTILQDHRSLQLAVLNACEGARTSSTDPFSGTAQSLVRQGIPAVVAMQFEITDNAAVAFAQEFYAAIAEGLPVDAGISEARRAIFGLGNDIEWGTPVVYLRGDGNLFDIHPAAAAAAAPAMADTGSEVEMTTVEPGPTAAQEEEVFPTPDDEVPPPPPWGRRLAGLPIWGWALVAVGALLALVVLLAVLDGDDTVASDTTPAPETSEPDSTEAPDNTEVSGTSEAADTSVIPTTSDWQVATPIPVEGKPIVVAPAGEVVWVTSFEGVGLSGIDPAADTVAHAIPIGEEADGLAVDADGTLWVVNPEVGQVWHIDPETGARLATVTTEGKPSKVALGEGAVWVVNGGSNSVSQIDPASLEVKTHQVGSAPAEVVVADGYVWVSNHESGTVSRIDPSNGSRLDIPVGDGPLGVTFGSDSIWVALTFENSVARIDLETLVVTTKIPVGEGPDGIAAGAGAVWVTNREDDTVSRIDPESERQVQVIDVPERPDGIAVGEGVVWVASYGDLTVANYVGGFVSRLEPSE